MIKTVTLFIVFTLNIIPQDLSLTDRLEKTSENIFKGFSESISWLDIPVAAFSLTKKHLHADDDAKYISINPFSFDRNFQKNIGIKGSDSPGSMDQNTIPNIILYSRLAFTVAENIISPQAVNEDNYKPIFIFYKSLMYTHTFTELAKNLIKRERPDGSDTRSFFSGHTSTTFAAASFLYLELNDFYDNWNLTRNDEELKTALNITSAAVLYGWAGYVGYCRMQDNKHYLSDIILGAAVGTTISHLLYNTYLSSDETIFDNISLGVINNGPALSLGLKF